MSQPVSLCRNCVHNYRGIDCVKDKMIFPLAATCNEHKLLSSNVALLERKVDIPKEPPPPPRTKWEIFSKEDPTKCIFHAILP